MATIRKLREADIDDCMKLKEAAGWNQTRADWLALLRCAPSGCFGIEVNGRVAATATAVTNDGVGWIGMVLTDPGLRGRGFATALTEHCLTYLDAIVDAVKLDASEQGEPIYRRLGFEPEAPIERWTSPEIVAPPAILIGRYRGPLRHCAIPIDAQAECTGAWGAGREGSGPWYFGPCYGQSDDDVAQVARTLITGRGPVMWDLFPSHPAAGIARELGFAPSRRLLRMGRGNCTPTSPDVYAIAGFEWG